MQKVKWIKSGQEKFPQGRWFIEFFTRGEFHAHQIKKLIAYSITQFQTVFLVDTVSFGKVLIIDGETQSTEYDEFIYHQALVLPALLLHNFPSSALILGGGEGATAREILNSKTIRRLVMVDIDYKVLEFAEKHLYKWHKKSFDDKRMTLLVQDAAKYIERSLYKFDLIYSDLPSPIKGGPAYKLYTLEFYRQLKKKLNSRGIFAMQAGPATSFGFELHSAIYHTVSKVFRKVLSYCFFIPGYDMPWSFLIASDEDFEFNEKKINDRIKQRLKIRPRLIDGHVVKNLYNIPLYLQEVLKKDRRVITSKSPIFFSTSRY